METQVRQSVNRTRRLCSIGFRSLLLSLLLGAGLLPAETFAQSVVIGNTTGTSSYFYGPIYRSSATSTFNYSRYAYVYTASELGIPVGAVITNVAWLKANSGTLTGNNTFKVWLENSSATSLTSGTNWGSLTATATQVYSSTTQEFTGAADTWESYTITPFTYTGGSLILLTDHAKTGTASGSLTYYTTAATNMAIGYASGTAPTETTTLSTGSYGNTRPTLRITFGSGTPCSGTPAVAVATASVGSACAGVPFTLNATGMSIDGGITYQWQSRPAGIGAYTDIAGATSSSFTVLNQTVATEYRFVVTCTNPGGGASFSNVVNVAQSAPSSCYCIPASNCTNEGITNVTLNTLHNSSAYCSTPGGYENYTGIGDSATTTLNKNGNYTLNMSARVNSNPGTGGFWIDYNQNGVFETTEFTGFNNITTFTGTAFIGVLSKTFTVPATALTGTTRLRVRYNNSAGLTAAQACATGLYGETEDYLITIAPEVPCSGTPATASASASLSTVCAATPFTLNATGLSTGISGISYQWQSRAAGSSDPFADILSATTVPYIIASQTTATEYRLKVTCSGGSSSNSNTVLVGQNPPSSCFCTPTSGGGTTYYITNFTTTGGATNISNTSGSAASGYTDFHTTATASALPGTTINFSMMAYSPTSTFGRAIWVDWNEDGIFQTTERVANTTGYVASPWTGNFVIPISTTPGNKRMRIVAAFTITNPSDPCTMTSSGEYEDYTLNVLPLTPCTGTPAAGITSTATAICAGVPLTLTATPSGLSGFTYEFQSSTDGGVTWPSLAAAGPSSTYTVPSQTVTTQYRVIVTCSGGGSNTSAAITVTQNLPSDCYCTPTTGSSTTYYITNFTTTGGITNIDNTSGAGTAGYTDFHTSASASALQGATLNFSMMAYSPTSTFGRAIWVDWDENGIFEASERVANTTGYVGSPWTGSFVVPVTATPGNKRMRIVAAFTITNPSDPCAMTSSGEYEDYTLTVVALTPCTGTPTAGNTMAFSTVHVTGFTQDIVANGIGPVSGSTTADADGAGFYFLTGDFQATSSSPLPTYYLPLNGLIQVSALPGLKFQLANYSGNNALRLNSSTPGTLTLTTPKKGTMVYLLGTSGSGSSTISATVNFTDGSSQVFSGIVLSDWYGGTTNVALQGIGRVSGTGGLEGTANDPRLYYFPLALDASNYDKNVSGITIARTAGTGIPEIMGVSMKTHTPEAHTVCASFTTVVQAANVVITSSGITMQWQESSSATGPFADVTGGSGATTLNYTTGTLSSNTYFRLKVTCTASGLSAYSDTIAVIANSGIPITTPPANTGVCLGQPLTLSVAATGAISYQWYQGGTLIPGATGSTYTVPAAALSDAGSYTVELNNCTMSPAATVTVSTPFSVSLGTDTTICIGEILTLDAGNPGATYTWSTGDATQTIAVGSAGTYTVTVQQGACTVMDTIQVAATPYPVVDLGADTAICGTVSMLLNAGNPGATYVWNTGDNSQTLAISAAGTYSVAVSNGSCVSTDTIVISSAAAPETGTIDVTGTMPTFTFSTSGTVGAETYSWLLGDGTIETGATVTHTYIANGVYTVHLTVTNACGLMDTTSILVTVSGLAVDYIPGRKVAVQVYPNPSGGLTIVEAGGLLISRMEALDHLGRVALRQQPHATKAVMDVKSLTPGIYTLRIQTEKGISAVKLVVK